MAFVILSLGSGLKKKEVLSLLSENTSFSFIEKKKHNKKLFSGSISIKFKTSCYTDAVEVGRVLVALPDFKSGVSG